MPGVFPNLSFTTSPVTSATPFEQGVTLPAARVSRKKKKKGTAAAGIYCTWQFHKMNMRVMCSVHKVLTYFFFLSTPLSIFLFEYLIFPFLPQYIFSEPFSFLVTQISVLESELESPKSTPLVFWQTRNH